MADLCAYSDMPCPKCDKRGSKVIDSRGTLRGYIRRRRHCLKCGHRFSTRELPDDDAEVRSEITRRLSLIEKAIGELKSNLIDGL